MFIPHERPSRFLNPAYENYLGDLYLNDDALSLYFFDVPVGGRLLPGCQGLDPQSPLVTAFLPVLTGMHSTHRMFGCEIQEDSHFNSFWRFGYDGQDHVSLDMETLSWVRFSWLLVSFFF